MGKHMRLPVHDAGTTVSRLVRPRRSRSTLRYFAFLSYSHKDEELADWLHDELEGFHVPPELTGRLTDNGVIPKRLAPIFRDEHELAAASDLSLEIEQALRSSQFLVVLCSPEAAKSRWTNAEIELFKRTRPDGCVLAAIAAGEPFASDIPGREAEECFPPALRQKFDRRGRPTGKRAEPLAADLREEGDGRRLGLLRLVAGMLGVGLDDLVQRETTRRHRRLAWLTAASLAGMAVTSTLAFTAVRARDEARDQRREAEGLVEFMLGDLKEKLEPIGRLDALDGVGAKVLAYYSKQKAGDLTDEGLLQRSRALNLTAQVAYARGDLDAAQRLYREALAGTAEAIARKPDDPQALFDHAQNVFWVADIERERGHVKNAEDGMREYKRIADQLVRLAPDNMKWRMEQQSADTNLGVLLFEQRRFHEATQQFTRAFQSMQALAAADPRNSAYQKAATESQVWLADAYEGERNLKEASRLRADLVTKLQQLLAQTGDAEYRQKLVPAQRLLGELYLALGNTDPALKQLSAAVTQSDYLVAREPENSRWKSFSARARLTYAEGLLTAGRTSESAQQTESACAMTSALLATDNSVQTWRSRLRDCWEMRSRVALAAGHADVALVSAQRALDIATKVQTTDRFEDRFALAQTHRLLGDAQSRTGSGANAQNSWRAALAALPAEGAAKPNEMAEHAILLQRLGQTAEAGERTTALKAMGYRKFN